MINVEGGTLPQSSHLAGTAVPTFQIGKYEVTWAEWQEVRAWAVQNGYTELVGVGAGSGGNHPVRMIAWHQAVQWCNAKSEKEGLTPVYRVNGDVYRISSSGELTLDVSANGYRLPTSAEWEWAARGGTSSGGHNYSGSDNVSEVTWFFDNSAEAVVNLSGGRGTWPAGEKAPNELGIYDMSGNVSEWCEDFTFPLYRFYRGGNWLSEAELCMVGHLGFGGNPRNPYSFLGFRLVRSSGA